MAREFLSCTHLWWCAQPQQPSLARVHLKQPDGSPAAHLVVHDLVTKVAGSALEGAAASATNAVADHVTAVLRTALQHTGEGGVQGSKLRWCGWDAARWWAGELTKLVARRRSQPAVATGRSARHTTSTAAVRCACSPAQPCLSWPPSSGSPGQTVGTVRLCPPHSQQRRRWHRQWGCRQAQIRRRCSRWQGTQSCRCGRNGPAWQHTAQAGGKQRGHWGWSGEAMANWTQHPCPCPLQVSEHLTQGTTTSSTRTHMPCSPGAAPGASFAPSQASQVAVNPGPQLGDVCIHAWPAVASLVEEHVAFIPNCAQGSMQRIRDSSKRERERETCGTGQLTWPRFSKTPTAWYFNSMDAAVLVGNCPSHDTRPMAVS